MAAMLLWWKMERTLWFDSIISKYTPMHWLAKLKWDGKQRLRFCSQLCEIDENIYIFYILHYFFICLWESDNFWKRWFFGQLLRDWQFGKCKIFQSKNSFDLQKKGKEIERCMWKGRNLFGKRWKECKVEMSLNLSTTQNKSQ